MLSLLKTVPITQGKTEIISILSKFQDNNYQLILNWKRDYRSHEWEKLSSMSTEILNYSHRSLRRCAKLEDELRGKNSCPEQWWKEVVHGQRRWSFPFQAWGSPDLSCFEDCLSRKTSDQPICHPLATSFIHEVTALSRPENAYPNRNQKYSHTHTGYQWKRMTTRTASQMMKGKNHGRA